MLRLLLILVVAAGAGALLWLGSREPDVSAPVLTSEWEVDPQPAGPGTRTHPGSRETAHATASSEPAREQAVRSAGPTDPSRSDSRDGSDPYPVLTASNVASFFITRVGYEDSRRAVDLLVHIAEEQPVDAKWASQVVAQTNRILVDSGVGAYADAWTIDCRTSICVVSFDVDLNAPHAARETIRSLEDGVCRTAFLRHDAGAQQSVLFLFRENFEYVRAAGSAPL